MRPFGPLLYGLVCHNKLYNYRHVEKVVAVLENRLELLGTAIFVRRLVDLGAIGLSEHAVEIVLDVPPLFGKGSFPRAAAVVSSVIRSRAPDFLAGPSAIFLNSSEGHSVLGPQILTSMPRSEPNTTPHIE
jgi:hypothetical protein